MLRVRLIHWNTAEAEERAAWLQSCGYEVGHAALDPASLRALKENPPSAVVIDLGRLPSQGRDVAVGIRKPKATRHVPLVFVDGDPEKVARIKKLLPDAVYTTWSQIGAALEQAIAHPPTEPVVPGSVMDAYAGTPLVKKLGIKAHATVNLVGAPQGFEETLGDLPQGVTLCRGAHGRADVTLWFTTSREQVERDIEKMCACAAEGGLWIIWPKKSSGMASDLSQNIVRKTGLAAGLVDFKVCAVDVTWSGLRFTQRKPE